MSPRKKIILGIALIFIIIAIGVIYFLNKTGRINIFAGQLSPNGITVKLRIADQVVAVPGVNITLTNTADNSQISRLTGTDGEANFPTSSSGTYTAMVDKGDCSQKTFSHLSSSEQTFVDLYCQTGINEECNSNADCPADKRCNLPSNKCESIPSQQINVYYKVATQCTDSVSCPNRNEKNMIENIPVILETRSQQLSSNHFRYPELSGVFENMLSGQTKKMYINPANNPNYLSAYTSKTIDVKVEEQGFNNSMAVNIELEKNSSAQVHTSSFNLLGVVKDEQGNYLEAGMSLKCSGFSSCNLFGPSKSFNSINHQETYEGVTNNYKSLNNYNIAQSGSAINYLILKVSKTGYYYDANKNGSYDTGEDGEIKINKSDIKNPTSYGKSSYAIKDIILKKNNTGLIKVYGKVKSSVDNQPISSSVKLMKILKNGNLDEKHYVFDDTDESGNYEINNIGSWIDTKFQYMLIAEPKVAGLYSKEYISVVFKKDTSLHINFSLQYNSKGYITITGLVQDASQNGIYPVSSAQVLVHKDGFLFDYPLVNTSADANGKYTIKFDTSYIFESIQNPNATATIILTAFNGTAEKATKNKKVKIQFSVNNGALIRQDFLFNNSDTSLSEVATKDVTITVTKQLKKYEGYSEDNPMIVSAQAPKPYSGIVVQIKSLRSENEPGSSGIGILSEEKVTDRDGRVTFTGYPKQASEIIVKYDSKVYQPEVSEDFRLANTQTQKTINVWKINWDPNRLKLSRSDIAQTQGNNRWAGQKVRDFTTGTVGAAGCCLTSLSMAIRNYYWGKSYGGQEMNPGLLARISNQLPYPSALFVSSGWPRLLRSLNSQYSMNVTTKSIPISEINAYLKLGIPVIIHSTKNTMHRHGEHCILLTSVSNGMYGIIDPNPKDGNPPGQYWPESYLGNRSSVFAVLTPDAINVFKSSKSALINKNLVFASTGAITARTDSDLKINAEVQTTVASSIMETFIRLKRNNSKDILIKMNATSDLNKFNVVVPKHLISGDFKYSIVAINSNNNLLESDETNVAVQRIANSPARAISRTFSKISYSVRRVVRNTAVIVVEARATVSRVLNSVSISAGKIFTSNKKIK